MEMVVARTGAFWRSERGAGAVEFALIAPLLILMLLSAADLALAVNQRMVMQHILRVGAQTAMAGGSLSEVERALETAEDTLATGRMSELSVSDPVIDWRCGTRSVDRRDSCGRGREPSAVFVFAAGLPFRSIVLGDRLGMDIEVALELEVPLSWSADDD
ncbi:TadE/TadG family type IV pilus assembly protein [Nioella sp.]|uniref:TadE/TadG family type IV pilus assembly protein n=1 Tax=Nioella sp. TaxID=1912091 RepID=UPI003B515697